MNNSIKAIILLAGFLFSLSIFSAENLFEKNYQQQSPDGFKSFSKEPDTKITRGWDRKTDITKMLEKGYDLMGYSGFTSLNLPHSLAVDFGKKIKSDLVLMYDRQINGSSKAAKFKAARQKAIAENRLKTTGNVTEIEITESDLADPNVRFDFYTTYWVKLPKPTFGTHFIKLKGGEDKKAIEGVQVIAVIEDSPAHKAGILKNDSINSINNIKVDTPDDLIKLIRLNKGKEVEVTYKRNGQINKVLVAL
jgi:hypothetical protein